MMAVTEREGKDHGCDGRGKNEPRENDRSHNHGGRSRRWNSRDEQRLGEESASLWRW
jgi:hypothetical protein